MTKTDLEILLTVAGGGAIVALVVALVFFLNWREDQIGLRMECAVKMSGSLTEASYAAATRDACTAAGILSP